MEKLVSVAGLIPNFVYFSTQQIIVVNDFLKPVTPNLPGIANNVTHAGPVILQQRIHVAVNIIRIKACGIPTRLLRVELFRIGITHAVSQVLLK